VFVLQYEIGTLTVRGYIRLRNKLLNTVIYKAGTKRNMEENS